jgi:UDP-3-O-[3-hydroxymyristoyl] N-acetylglucosamine deacetylase
VATVEHLFAALAGAGVYEGVAIDVEGPEVPLLDGASRAWTRLISKLTIASKSPTLCVVKGARVEVGASRYTFSPSRSLHTAVTIDFDDPRLTPDASWNGDPAEFADRVAPARTFAFAREIPELAAHGLASHVAPESVVVLEADRVHASGDPFEWDEPARHKLLDLIGDLYLYGGPPIGAVHAHRPGHAATHEAMRRAVVEGVVVAR